MKRRRFLGCLASATVARPLLAGTKTTQATKLPANVAVVPDERFHIRTFPPPPIAKYLEQFPHDWLTAFQDLEKWDIAVEGLPDPHVRRCRYRPLFHETHVEISWSSAVDGKVVLTPPSPLQLPDDWNAVDFWIGGLPNEYRGPWMECTLHCVDRTGSERSVEICGKTPGRHPHGVDLFHRLVPQAARKGLERGAIKAIEIRVRTQPADRRGLPESEIMLQLYALTAYRHHRKQGYQRPQLPFPTQPDGVVPSVLAPGTASVDQGRGDRAETRFLFKTTQGSSLVYTYTPKSGTFDDLSVSVDGAKAFRPLAGGGIVFENGGTRLVPPYRPSSATLVNQRLDAARLITRWQAQIGNETIRYSLSLRLVNRSLIVEAEAEGNSALEMRIGYPDDAGKKRPIEVPMLVWDWNRWTSTSNFDYEHSDLIARKGGRGRSPAVLLVGDVFASAVFDWYVSDASFVYASAEAKGEPAGFDGGACYLPVIDQGRNPLKEKLILTLSKEFQEVLPNIPNPPSRFTEMMRDRVYSHGMSPGISIARHRNLGIHGVATLAQSYHAGSDRGGYRPSLDMGCMDDWIDDPGRSQGGLERLIRVSEQFRSIGWMIGTYTNYCMMNPAFPCFAELPPALDSNGFPQTRWPGTMVPVAGETLPYLKRQSEKIKKTMGYQIIYDDQRTIVPIWRLNDYTPGTPGAGKFRETFEQGALLYWTRGELYGGPILSEGGMQWMYSGLVDGNLARTQHHPHDPESPYLPPADLVDFQLLKIHRLTVDNCGNNYFDSWAPEARDRFICQTLAYGKAGLWSAYTGQGQETQSSSCRAYFAFHLAQKRYRCVAVDKILYHNGVSLVDTSTIIKQGKERLGRVYVRYQNGFESWTNLNEREPWTVTVDGQEWRLPPYGWIQQRKEGWGTFQNYSLIFSGRRCQRIEDEQTMLVGAPGSLVRWDDVETDGTVLLQREETGGCRVINLDALTLKVKAALLRLNPNSRQAVMHLYDLDGTPVRDGVVSIENGWVDLSFLDQEQFARLLP